MMLQVAPKVPKVRYVNPAIHDDELHISLDTPGQLVNLILTMGPFASRDCTVFAPAHTICRLLNFTAERLYATTEILLQRGVLESADVAAGIYRFQRRRKYFK